MPEAKPSTGTCEYSDVAEDATVVATDARDTESAQSSDFFSATPLAKHCKLSDLDVDQELLQRIPLLESSSATGEMEREAKAKLSPLITDTSTVQLADSHSQSSDFISQSGDALTLDQLDDADEEEFHDASQG